MHLEQEPEQNTMDAVVVTPFSYMNVPGTVEEVPENKDVKMIPLGIKQSKWKIVKEHSNQIVPQNSIGEIKLSSIIDELKKFSISEQAQEVEDLSITNSWTWVTKSRRRLAKYLTHPRFHYCIIGLVIIDLCVVLVDLVLAQLSTPCLTETEMEQYNTTIQRDTCLLPYSIHLYRGEVFLFFFSVLLLIIFVSEVFLSFYAFGWRHFTNPLYLLDGVVVFASFIMELYFHYGNIGRAGRAAAAVVILRLWKIVRAIHAVAHSITLKNRLLIKKIQEAQTVIEDEKQTTEKMLEKQDIKVEYLSNLLKAHGKLPTPMQIEIYVDKTWQQRKKEI